jgi:hypothetical protein
VGERKFYKTFATPLAQKTKSETQVCAEIAQFAKFDYNHGTIIVTTKTQALQSSRYDVPHLRRAQQ